MNSFILNINNQTFNNNNKITLKEIGYKVLSDNGQIKEPDIKENRKNIYYINNNDLNNKIRNKDMLTEENIYILFQIVAQVIVFIKLQVNFLIIKKVIITIIVKKLHNIFLIKSMMIIKNILIYIIMITKYLLIWKILTI